MFGLPTSYRFQANIHGGGDAASPAEAQAWNQCQHGSFYFFSWHRMYLYFFDRILRAAAQDPSLVLPYWDWTQPDQRALPLPFREPADSSNPLFIATATYGRSKAFNSGQSLDPMAVEDSAAMKDTDFETFGGQVDDAPVFDGKGGAPGDFENQPHNAIHTELGGAMGIIMIAAAEDPVFFLHHANIDRLWNSWLAQRGGRADPADAAWLNTRFTFFDEAGHAVYLTGSQIVDSLEQLNYRYDLEPAPPPRIHKVLTHLAQLPDQRPHKARTNIPRLSEHAQLGEVLAVNEAQSADARVNLGPTQVRVKLPISETARATLRRFSNDVSQHWILRIEDVRTSEPPGYYYEIYIDPPAGVPLDSHTPGFVGTLSFFSMGPHKMPNGTLMPEEGVSSQYNISALIDPLIGRNPTATTIVFDPHGPVNSGGEQLPLPSAPIITAGKIQLLRQ
jgi:hypothetical protein